MKQLHYPKDTRTFAVGANYDINKEFLVGDKGNYIDSNNMRPVDMSEDNGALKKIKGEELKYGLAAQSCPNFTIENLTAAHRCLGTVEVNNHIVELWAYPAADINIPSQSPCIRIDGYIVAQSHELQFDANFPFQIAKNEACTGGEIYLTDNNKPPKFFNVQDLLDNSGAVGGKPCTPKYFADYDPSQNTLSIKNTINTPKLFQVVTTNSPVGYDIITQNAGTGLDVGVYAYGIRFLDETGNRTEISEFTPQLPAFFNLDSRTDQHPWAYTYGGDVGDTTPYGFHLIIRADGRISTTYKECEVIRLAWTSGTAQALGVAPTGFVVMRFDLEEDTIRDYHVVDRSMSTLEAVGEEEASIQINAVNRAKAIRFYNNRLYLMNVGTNSTDIDGFDIGGETEPTKVDGFAYMEHMEWGGHHNPYNFGYRRGYMNSDRYGYGIVYRDQNGSKTFAQQLQFDVNGVTRDYFEFPRRRQLMSAKAQSVCYTGASYQADGSYSNGTFTPLFGLTYEPYEFINPTNRTSGCKFMNFLDEGSKPKSRVWGSSYSNKDPQWAVCNDSDIPDSWVDITNVDTRNIYRQPHPHDLGDAALADSTVGHAWQVMQEYYNFNGQGALSIFPDGSYDHRRKINNMFRPDLFSMGLAISKINSPDWATSFSIVRTPAANKVLAQGLAFYSINDQVGSSTGASKDTDGFIFYSSDWDTAQGLLSSTATDVENAPQRYTVVLESAMGFQTEFWSSKHDAGSRSTNVDMLSFCSMMKDFDGNLGLGNGYNDGQKYYLYGVDNAVTPAGASPTPTSMKYVCFGRWRNGKNQPTESGTSLTQNKREYQITSCTYISGAGTRGGERGGHHWKIEVADNGFYKNAYAGVASGLGTGREFWNQNVKDFHEPIYIVSICNLFNEPLQGQNVKYLSTGHIQQIRSLFYMSQGVGFSSYLTDERWEDCIPSLNDAGGQPINGSLNPAASIDYYKYNKFVYVQDLTGNERKYINVTNMSAPEIDNILNQIDQNGNASWTDGFGNTDTQIYGIYSHEITGQYGRNEQFKLIFDDSIITQKGLNPNDYPQSAFIIPAGHIVIIKYDDRIPIRIMGGDAHIGESLMVISDAKYQNGNPVPFVNQRFDFDLPIPYNEFRINERMCQVNRLSGVNKIQDNNRDSLYRGFATNNSAYLRQWLAHYISMARTPIESQYMKPQSKSDVNQYYPLVNYRMRPFNWNTNDVPNNIPNVWQDYFDDFGAEYDWWQFGGFRFIHTINQDYAQSNSYHSYIAKPVSFEEETDFCTRIIWSEVKPINVKDSPNVRTFPTLNFFDISDDTGEIKYAYDTEGTRGSNLYAVTESGVCVLITDKRILSEVSGQALATMGSEQQGVQKQVWIDKHIGMPKELWESAAESQDSLYWCNIDSVFQLKADTVVDIGRKKYYNKINPILDMSDVVGDKIIGSYDKRHSEYRITVGLKTMANLGRYNESFMFAYKTSGEGSWIGGYSFRFDKYLCTDNAKSYGMRDGETYELNKGNIINGTRIKSYVITASSPSQPNEKEFSRIRINSDTKPTKVEFFTKLSEYEANTPIADLNTVINPLALKNYFGWEQYIPRRSDNTNRLQGRVMLYKIEYDGDDEYALVDTVVQYKVLK
jgi:hypothetical protein